MVDQPSSFLTRTSSRVVAAAVAIAPIAVLGGAVLALNPSAQLERGLASAAALEARIIASNDAVSKTATTAVAGRTFEEGSEGFWLSRAPDAGSDAGNLARVAWKAPVSAGDRVIVNLGAHDRQILEVVSVVEEIPATTRIDTGTGKSARYIVTGRRAGASPSDLIRLTVDAEGRGLTTITGAADRAL